MKTPALRLTILIAVTLLLLSGCNNTGKIPVDEKNAQGNVISVEQAKAYTQSFVQARQDLGRRVGDAYLRDTFNLPDAEMFNRDAIALLLNAEGAQGVRIYLGRDEKVQVRLVLLPVDKDGKNIITRLITSRTAFIPGVKSANAQDGSGNDGEAIENGQRFPTMCDQGW